MLLAEWTFPAIKPWLVDLGFLQLRWYGLMYVVAFLAGQWVLMRLVRDRFVAMTERQASDIILWLVLGVLLGGRLGYCLFYHPEFLREPLQLIRVWEGGLSFHGGFLGVVLAFVLFARRHGIPVWRLGDCMGLVVPPGIFAVRCANFINGELYGRVTDTSVPWAMRFPTDPAAHAAMQLPSLGTMHERELAMLKAIEDGTWERVKDQVPLRHPSQLYEAIGEGLVLGLLLWALYRWTRPRWLGGGVYGGLFILGYGLVRFGIEFFRQPDAQFVSAANPIGTVALGLSMGQLLCLGMILVGGLIVLRGLREGRAALPAP